MSQFIKRVIFGALYVAILSLGILYSQQSFVVLFFILMLFTLFEFIRLIKLDSVFPYIISVSLFVFLNSLNINSININDKIPAWSGIILFLSSFAAFMSSLFLKKEAVVIRLGKVFLSIVYIALPFSLITLIPFINNEFAYIHITILGVFILVWVNDSFAYLTGSLIGKRKLFESVSPNKTWEGFFGGMLFTFLAAYVLSLFFTKLSLVNWIVFAGIVSTFGVMGDLIESMFKRQAGVKDTSNLIPGHGGFLDRLDSILFSAPFIFIYLMIIS